MVWLSDRLVNFTFIFTINCCTTNSKTERFVNGRDKCTLKYICAWTLARADNVEFISTAYLHISYCPCVWPNENIKFTQIIMCVVPSESSQIYLFSILFAGNSFAKQYLLYYTYRQINSKSYCHLISAIKYHHQSTRKPNRDSRSGRHENSASES